MSGLADAARRPSPVPSLAPSSSPPVNDPASAAALPGAAPALDDADLELAAAGTVR